MKKRQLSFTPTNLPKNYFSKQLNKYDNELTFDKKLNHILRLHKKTPIFNSKELKIIFNQKSNSNENIFNRIKSKINESKVKPKLNSFSPLNEIAKQKRISYLPKISPYILSNKTSILIDYNKAEEMGSEGFRDFCNNENYNIKEICFAYNDHNFNSLKDYNSFSYFNQVNENVGYNDNNTNITNTTESNQKETEKNINNINTYLQKEENKNNNNNIIYKDIFDKNFMKRKKITKIKKLLLKKKERIKYQNKKANQFYELYKKAFIKRKGDNRHYKINYNSIEKHTPNTILYSNSQRVSPEYMIHTYFNYNYQKQSRPNENKKEIKLKTKKKEQNEQKEPKEYKEKFYVTNRSINVCNGNFNFDL